MASRWRLASAAALTLALAVGANLVVFTIANALWLKPAPVPDPDQVVLLRREVGVGRATEWGTVQYRQLERMATATRDGRPLFEAVAGQVATSGNLAARAPRVSLAATGADVEVLAVTWQYFRVFGLTVQGRDFSAADDSEGARATAILSWDLWQRAFNGSEDVIGRVIDASPQSLLVIGIAPRGFRGARLGEQTDVWVPSQVSPALAPPGMSGPFFALLPWARLAPGVSPRDVPEPLNAVMSRGGRGSRPGPVVTYRMEHPGEIYGTLSTATLAVGNERILALSAVTATLVLVSGVATLLALLVAHYEHRRRELAIRMALGASRGRLVWQLTKELSIVGLAGGIASLFVSSSALALLPSLRQAQGIDFSRLDLTPDWRVLAAAVVVTGTTLLAGAVLPLVRTSRGVSMPVLTAGSYNVPPSSLRVRQLALGGHAGATVLVMVGAALFVRTVLTGFGAGPGFDLDRTIFIEGPSAPVPDTVASQAAEEALLLENGLRVRRLADALAATPGVERVAVGRAPIGQDWALAAERPWTVEANGETFDLSLLSPVVGPGYFEAIGVRMVSGRPFEVGDVVRSQVLGPERNAIITRSVAETLWPGRDPVGQRLLQFPPGGSTEPYPYAVVGVVDDFVQGSLRVDHTNGVFVASDFEFSGQSSRLELTVRTRGDAASLVPEIQRVVSQEFEYVQALDFATGREVVARDLGQERVGAWFFSGFGVIALSLGLAGVAGLVAYLVASRRREIGIRMALGATPIHVMRILTRVSVLPVLAGVVAGLFGAMALSTTVAAWIEGLGRPSVSTYLLVGAVMVCAALVASVLSAQRIRSITPAEVLKAE